jgi:fatty acid desaturase
VAFDSLAAERSEEGVVAKTRQTKLKRPNPFQWIWYSFGGGLPEDRREWVLHDLTAKTRVLRHLVRSMVLISPLVGFWLFVPAPLGLRLALVLMGLIVGLFYSFAYLDESAEHRLVKAGYPRGMAKKLRAERLHDPEAEARYIATYRS